MRLFVYGRRVRVYRGGGATRDDDAETTAEIVWPNGVPAPADFWTAMAQPSGAPQVFSRHSSFRSEHSGSMKAKISLALSKVP